MNLSPSWPKHAWMSLSPLLVFLVLYLAVSIAMNDFYKMPLTVAFLLSSIYAVCITRHLPLQERITLFSKGAGNRNVLLMIWIFILAGAFAHTAKTMGAIDATVNLTLHVLPDDMLLPGLFLAACFISLSVGTSVGTVVALTPMAVGVAQQTNSCVPLIVAAVVGGAFFGDNLSFISDTTIIATQTQGCKMRDKFLANFRIVLPAALVVLLLYVVLGTGIEAPTVLPDVEWGKVVPYVMVLITAIAGLNVMLVLLIGLLLAGVIGMLYGSFDFWGWLGVMADGILNRDMDELIIVTLLAAGMLELIRENGGMDYMAKSITRHIGSKRGAELSIGGLAFMADICTANNTVAIITTGPIAKDIATRFGVDPRKSASILDTFSCFGQGIIPYGAQMLMASALSGLIPTQIMIYLFYPVAIGLSALLCIVFRYPRKYS
ncbi:MAG: Na+/H+ antiporter NhaC family protein [Bacteroidaceae bacterium]|nr:Na+/H+ antiporter NhaC family protein [Bacteroidaceae bacterium]